ncbi:unnamed protein product [Clavelina lepadiformis]|uniref:Fibrinogen C-terminal domain-containing protein n=1 Tax=Clavelina lepadiformis TaxID=159417 RepID=A0ABP0FKW7_CLALP
MNVMAFEGIVKRKILKPFLDKKLKLLGETAARTTDAAKNEPETTIPTTTSTTTRVTTETLSNSILPIITTPTATTITTNPAPKDFKDSSTRRPAEESDRSFPLGTVYNPATSCRQLYLGNVTESGYYTIQPQSQGFSFRVFCDMETSGGGWTLVATVHENDIEGKCTSTDLWFSNEAYNVNISSGSRNWENKFTFGQVELATSNDYKNPAYFELQASDLLVRHVPNQTPLNGSKKRCFFEYHTENGELSSYGGNLYNVFTKYYPLNPESKELSSIFPISTTTGYTKAENYLMVTSSQDRAWRCKRNSILMTSRRSQPYFALMAIGNFLFQTSYVYCTISSSRAIADPSLKYSDVLSNGNFKLKYNAVCRYNTTSSSLCDVTFLVTNEKDWKTPTRVSFPKPIYRISSSTYKLYQYIERYPTNAVFGYTMLSRTEGRLVSKNQTNEAMRKVLSIISQYKSIAPSCANFKENLLMPVTYPDGGRSKFVSSVPPSLRHSVNAGYIQLRARGIHGSTYAFCPAEVETCNSQYVCVGGVKRGYGRTQDCGDFLAWNGNDEQPPANWTHPTGFAHAMQDIQSTIMIFYR